MTSNSIRIAVFATIVIATAVSGCDPVPWGLEGQDAGINTDVHTQPDTPTQPDTQQPDTQQDVGQNDEGPVAGCQSNADCDDDDPDTVDTCNDGTCHNTARCESNADCNDFDDSTWDECIDGVCHHTTEKVCVSDSDCDDDNDLTQDLCVDDECVHVIGCTSDAYCDDGDPDTIDWCDDNGVCHSKTDICSLLECPDGFICLPDYGCVWPQNNCPNGIDDGNLCTYDYCDPIWGPVHVQKHCDDNDPSTIDYCDPSTGECINTDACGSDCNDGDPCTVDTCNQESGECEHTPVVCDWGTCVNGTCVCASDADCDDGNPNTEDHCIGGVCVNTEACTSDAACDDGNPCTNNTCEQGVCHTALVSCDDGDACTVDSCDETVGCQHAPVVCDWGVCVDGNCVCASDADCDDNNPDTDDQCVNGVCVNVGECETDADCDDGNPCTDEICHQQVCVITFNTDTCDDGNPCTVNDVCSQGECSGTQLTCDDGNLCTQDYCSMNGECVHESIDDLFCGLGTHCSQLSGQCVQDDACETDADCDDDNACTADECLFGFCHTASTVECPEDDQICNMADGLCYQINKCDIPCEDGKICLGFECVPSNAVECGEGTILTQVIENGVLVFRCMPAVPNESCEPGTYRCQQFEATKHLTHQRCTDEGVFAVIEDCGIIIQAICIAGPQNGCQQM